jgi:hypothetical protein
VKPQLLGWVPQQRLSAVIDAATTFTSTMASFAWSIAGRRPTNCILGQHAFQHKLRSIWHAQPNGGLPQEKDLAAKQID